MGKYFNRTSSILDVLTEQDKSIDEAKTLSEIRAVMDSANYFNLRQIAINTAIIADVLDRISTDHKDMSVDDLLKMIGDN